MMHTNLTPKSRRPLKPRHVAALLTLTLLLCNGPVARPQTGARDMKGETGRVVLIPNATVDAKELKFKADTDHDGMPDDDEAKNGTNPNDPSDADADADGDGLSNGDEVAGGSNVNSADSDGDGVSDGEEARLGFNPIDPTNTPPAGGTLVRLEVTPANASVSINSLLGQSPVHLRVRGSLSNGTATDLTQAPGTTYQSLDESVAIADDFGTVAGISAGSTSINVTAGGLTAQVPVSVTSFTPTPLASLDIPGYPNNVEVSGNYAYVAAGAVGLVVVDVSDRAAPHIVATLDTPGNADDLNVVGNRLYLADGPAGLHIFDLTTPSAPALLGTADTPGEAEDVKVSGVRAYVADGPAGLQIVSVADASAPTIVGSADTPGYARGVDVSGNLVVLADGVNPTPVGGGGDDNPPDSLTAQDAPANALVVVDVSDPSNPLITGRALLGDEAVDVEARDRVAYVATYNGGLQLVNFGAPASPRVVARQTGFWLTDVALMDNYVVSADAQFAADTPFYDINDPGDAAYLGRMDFSALSGYVGTGLALDAEHIYMTASYTSYFASGTDGGGVLLVGRYREAGSETEDPAGIAPTAAVTAPQTGQTVTEGEGITVAADATDDVAVAAVRLVVNGQTVMTDVAAPYSFSYRVPEGVVALSISAVAVDRAGNTGASPPVSITVAENRPPTVTINTPAEGATYIENQLLDLDVTPADEGAVAEVVLVVNGTETYRLTGPPYRQTVYVPTGVESMTVEARATDDLGKSTTASRTVSVVPDPLTTVTGRLMMGQRPLANATIWHYPENILTGADGSFAIPGVPTLSYYSPWSFSFGVELERGSRSVYSGEMEPVRGGFTDLGTIQLQPLYTATLPAPATAFAFSEFNDEYGFDFVLTFADRPAISYFSNEAGQLRPGEENVFGIGPVRSGAADRFYYSFLHTQEVGHPGQATTHHITSWEPQPTVTLETGLSREADWVALGAHDSFWPALAFLSRAISGEGAALGVRLADRLNDSGTDFYKLVQLPVEPNADLRSLAVADVDEGFNDLQADVLTIRKVSETEARLVVYRRDHILAFEPPVESPVTIRSGGSDGVVADFLVGNFAGSAAKDVVVLGDDRLRVYAGNGDGTFTPAGELLLPAGSTPTGIGVTYEGTLLVTIKNASDPTSKALLAYPATKGPGGEAALGSPYSYEYSAPDHASDVRVAFGGQVYGDYMFDDVVLIDGDRLITIVDVAYRNLSPTD